MIEIPCPDDFHHHFRDGDVLKDVVRFACHSFERAIVMPNLKPPVRTVKEALAYWDRILFVVEPGHTLTPLMTLYLTDDTTVAEINRAGESGVVFGVKLYPAGATTNSEFGVTSIDKVHDALAAMAVIGLPLLVHGEVTDPSVDIFDREKVFIETILKPLIAKHPTLKIVLEHITTEESVQFIQSLNNPDGTPKLNVCATITAHHLLYNRNDLFQGGICPHLYCLPILKREKHREALLQAATSGDPRFFLGTDSAPHSVATKESACGCAGIFTGHGAVELYAEAFDSVGRIDQLEGFASRFGQQFYNLPVNKRMIRLVREDWTVPETYSFGAEVLRPLRAGQVIRWRRHNP